MRQSWRWFGPSDPVTLREIRQAGATDIVTALHSIECGELWPESAIAERVRAVAFDQQRNRPTGLAWTVVESLPVHESIKTRRGDHRHHLEIYRESLRNLARHGLRTICFNFMPILDWTRTELDMEAEDGSHLLACDEDAVAAFDLHILRRPGAEADYSPEQREAARQHLARLDDAGRKRLADTILLGLPGTVKDLSAEELNRAIQQYEGIGPAELRENLRAFLAEIMPLCDELGVRMAIHPDDPPRPIFGLPRVMSTTEDFDWLFQAIPSRNCGLALCTGSLGGRRDNNPAAMFERFAARVHFAHFRNVAFESERGWSFHEAGHLTGAVDMVRAMKALIREEERRRAAGLEDHQIPVRPDHGKLLDCDRGRGCYPGYSYVGRLMGLAELRGLELGLRQAQDTLERSSR